MSETHSHTGSGSGVGRSDSQPNLISSHLLLETSDVKRNTLRNKRKHNSENETVLEELSEMRKQMAQMMGMLATLSLNQKEFMDNMSKDITLIKENLSNMKSTTDSLSLEQKIMKMDIINLSNKNAMAEEKIHVLESEVKLFKTTTALSSSLRVSSNTDESLMAEINDREMRSKNLILVGVPEPMSNELEERMNIDKIEIRKIIKMIDAECTEPVKMYRLGKYDPSKVRHMKVCFKSQDSVKTLLRNRKLFKSGTVKIFSDQTPKQQEYLKNVKDELNRRTDSGENNLTIKYIKGVPKVVEYHSKNKL